ERGAPGRGEVEPVGVGRGHYLVPLEHGQGAVEVDGLAPQLEVGLGGQDAEGALEAAREGGVLLGGDGAGGGVHGPGVPPRRGRRSAKSRCREVTSPSGRPELALNHSPWWPI